MRNLARFPLLLCLWGMACAQDVAPPAVPDLKEGTEEGRLQEKNRENIRSFLAQICLARNLPSLELVIRGGKGLVTEFYQIMLEEFPEKALKRCPTDFQEVIALKKREIQAYLDGIKTDIVWPYAEDEEISSLLFRYGLKGEEILISKWMAAVLNFGDEDTPAFKAARMRELKEEIEAGKIKVPRDFDGIEEEI